MVFIYIWQTPPKDSLRTVHSGIQAPFSMQSVNFWEIEKRSRTVGKKSNVDSQPRLALLNLQTSVLGGSGKADRRSSRALFWTTFQDTIWTTLQLVEVLVDRSCALDLKDLSNQIWIRQPILDLTNPTCFFAGVKSKFGFPNTPSRAFAVKVDTKRLPVFLFSRRLKG